MGFSSRLNLVVSHRLPLALSMEGILPLEFAGKPIELKPRQWRDAVQVVRYDLDVKSEDNQGSDETRTP